MLKYLLRLNSFKNFLVLLVIVASLAGCQNGKIPCPSFGKSKLFSAFRGKKKPGMGGAKEAPSGQNVTYTKNGLIKTKNYKRLKQDRHKQKKYKYKPNFNG
ncbi:hypothetical protein [Adhaeribacter aquaticus]|uniref:hypothetical protein n=1 Tax=Adhaeribacter aquaticus TaxID=299567 RepID=UPI000478C538|nr:hypothetical protein [Adhaeribacter aquaticus]